ncbi:MAG: C25 family cysteine peptidase, partial [Bacteroidales bacterium]|nr:C25 family cysteine peptidase [Bacteroidales bacterium]
MKKILLMLTMVAVSVIAFAQSNTIVLQSNASKAECTKDAFEGFNAVFSYQNIEGEVISTERGNFTVISIEGTYPTGLEGTPQLPASRKLIAVPQGATPVVTVKNYTETEYDLNDYGFNAIYPNQPSVRKDMKPEDVKFIYSEKAYAAKGYQEREIAQVEMLGTMRNMRIATLTVNPVVYDASSNTVKVRNNIEVEVTFEGADKMATQSLYEATYSIYFESLYRQMFNRSVYDDHPDLWAAPVHMIVVAPDSYNETLQPWLAWKTKKGFYVDLYNTSETGTTYTAIRDFVHNKYNEGVANSETPVFLVLVGDTPQIPGTNGSSSQEVTDLYYSSVDGDYFPEMFCSRMCCENTTTLASLINKILVYEKATMPDPSYLGNALLIAGADSGWNPQVGQPAINYATTYHFNTDHNYNAGGVHAYLSSYTNCYSWLNSGVAIANYTAHGSNTSWADPSFSVSNVASLTNVDKYFLAIGNCCIAADFGYSGVCLAEAMIRADQKGAYTYIGSCPSTYWYEDYYWGVGATTVVNGSTPTPQNSSTGVYDGMNMIDTYNTT